MRFIHVVLITDLGKLVMYMGLVFTTLWILREDGHLVYFGFLIVSSGASLIAATRFILRRENQRSPRNAVQPSGVPCGEFLDVGSLVLAPLNGKWWRGEVVTLHPEDRYTVRFEGASPFWDLTFARAELQEPKSA
jgi:hypothetical protein